MIYRVDRDFLSINCSRGGGVLLAVNSYLTSSRVDVNNFNFASVPMIDLLVVKVSNGHRNLHVITV